MDYTDKIITLEDGKSYIVIDQLNIDEHIYLYMVEETNEDNSAFVEIKDGSISKIDSEIFDTKVFPMFLEKFREY